MDKIINKCNLFFKSLGLILIILFGPSIGILIFGNNYGSFSTSTKVIILFLCDLLILGLFVFLYFKTLKKDFKNFFNKKFLDNLETAFKYWFVGFLVMLVSNLIISSITNGQIADNETSVREMIKLAPIYMIFSVSIYAPICEELCFRKSIRDIFKNKYLFIIISGLVFGGLHVVTSITSYMDLLYLIPYSALGIAFASLYYKSNNIFSSIIMHCMHNTMAIILYFLVL